MCVPRCFLYFVIIVMIFSWICFVREWHAYPPPVSLLVLCVTQNAAMDFLLNNADQVAKFGDGFSLVALELIRKVPPLLRVTLFLKTPCLLV